jgi:hypothetical protein
MPSSSSSFSSSTRLSVSPLEVREPLPEGGEYISPTKAAIRAKLRAKQEASRTDWLAFQEAKQAGRAWQAHVDKDAP